MRGAKLFVLSVILGCLAYAEAQTYSIDVKSFFQPQNFLVTIPAHSKSIIELHVANTLDSEQVARIRATWGRLIGPALEQKLIAYEAQDHTASKVLSFLGFFGGKDKNVTTFDETSDKLEELGVSLETAAQMMDVFYKEAKQMHDVDLVCYVDNTANEYSVSGNVVLLDLEGRIKVADANETRFYRALSSDGTFALCSDILDECPPKANVVCELTRKPTEASGTNLPTMPHPDFE